MATNTLGSTKEYTDLDLNFTIHPIRKDINKNKAEIAVINSVKNLVSTAHYEMPFQPEIGSNMRKLLFEPMDTVTASLVQREINETVTNFEPRVSISKIDVVPDYDNNRFQVTMQFYIINRTDPILITFYLERVR